MAIRSTTCSSVTTPARIRLQRRLLMACASSAPSMIQSSSPLLASQLHGRAQVAGAGPCLDAHLMVCQEARQPVTRRSARFPTLLILRPPRTHTRVRASRRLTRSKSPRVGGVYPAACQHCAGTKDAQTSGRYPNRCIKVRNCVVGCAGANWLRGIMLSNMSLGGARWLLKGGGGKRKIRERRS